MINIMEPPATPPATPLIAAVYVRKKRKRSSSTDDDEHPFPPSSPSKHCSTPTKVVCLKKGPISASAVGEEVYNRGSHYCSVSNINPSSLLKTKKDDMVYNGEPLSLQFEPGTPSQKPMNKGRHKKQQHQAEKKPTHVFRWPRACHNKKWSVNKYAREGALSSTIPRGPVLQNRKSNKKGKNVQVYDTTPVPIKKRRQPKPKIHNLLMKVDKEKWWAEHLKEVDSFISCIRSIQGDRCFIPWKGSVVDSVIGVFLTQNVSDINSSSAFISLAARFPTSDNRAQHKEEINRSVVETEVGIEKLSIKTRIGQGHTNLQTTEGKESCSGSNSEAKYRKSRCQFNNSVKGFCETTTMDTSKVKKVKVKKAKVNTLKVIKVKVEKVQVNKLKGKKAKGKKVREAGYWECLRKAAYDKATKEERNTDYESSLLDHDALRDAKVRDIAEAIKGRGQHNRLARRIKAFLNKMVKNHGSIDLEWLKNILSDEAKEYLMSIYGLGVKSVECILLLTLHQAAFPVDTNVGRIAVRLGWVPLKPRPENDLLHLLTLYPVQKTIHKFIWPMLCKLDQATLYELHNQMITFGKVFCTKNKPNCNACPMKAQCKYYASELASKRSTLPGTEGKAVVPPMLPIVAGTTGCEPVIEEPSTPANRWMEVVVPDIEDAFYKEKSDERPSISHNFEKLLPDVTRLQTETASTSMSKLKNVTRLQTETASTSMSKLNNVTRLQTETASTSMSKLNNVIRLQTETASTSMSKLKNVTEPRTKTASTSMSNINNRLRTEHHVYELLKGHPLLDKLDKRLPDDPCPYLLALWAPGETEESTKPLERCHSWLESGSLCKGGRCLSCSSIREENVTGTLLIPVKTTMRERFPLNGTYFQVNEVFVDHSSSIRPISVPRDWMQNLEEKTIYFGTTVNSIYRGLSKEKIQFIFNKGYICVRGFDRVKRVTRPLGDIWRALNNQKRKRKQNQRVNGG